MTLKGKPVLKKSVTAPASKGPSAKISKPSTFNRQLEKKATKEHVRHLGWKQHLNEVALKRQKELQISKKNPLGFLDALEDSLPATTDSAVAASQEPAHPMLKKLKSNRSRQRALLNEMNQFKLVLENPAFRANPTEAICRHLNNTMSAVKNSLDPK